jgi:hypothetical protein
VYYCAPRFHNTDRLVAALRGSAVVASSELITVASLGDVTPGVAHSVSFPEDAAGRDPHIHSEARRGERKSWDALMTRTREPRRLDVTFFRSLEEAAATLVVLPGQSG